MIFTSPDAPRIAIGFGRASYVITILTVRRDKSSVDDFDMERGIVSVRVGFALRSAEIHPLVPLICSVRLRSCASTLVEQQLAPSLQTPRA
eukprot:56926-Eustigmatos_ZCMA.PRE.2